jgi:hypothetical protein
MPPKSNVDLLWEPGVTASFREGASPALLALLRKARETAEFVAQPNRGPLATALAQRISSYPRRILLPVNKSR